MPLVDALLLSAGILAGLITIVVTLAAIALFDVKKPDPWA